jgi:hypothetical protein
MVCQKPCLPTCVIQDYPSNYIYSNEQDRFGQAGRLWKQVAGQGSGVPKLNEQAQKVAHVGNVRWTIKDGIVYDAQALLSDVRAMVKAEKIAAGLNPDIPMSVEQ